MGQAEKLGFHLDLHWTLYQTYRPRLCQKFKLGLDQVRLSTVAKMSAQAEPDSLTDSVENVIPKPHSKVKKG